MTDSELEAMAQSKVREKLPMKIAWWIFPLLCGYVYQIDATLQENSHHVMKDAN